MKKPLLLLGLLTLGFMRVGFAQQDAQFTQYMFNQLFYNPAYAGLDNGTRFQALGRFQWLGYNTSNDGSGGINTFVLSANAPWQAARSGVGFHAVIDNIGNRRREEYQLSLAHHIPVGEGKLSVALRPGIYGERIVGEWRARDGVTNDPLLSQLTNNPYSYRLDMGVGAMYQYKSFYAGVSASRLLGSQLNYGISNAEFKNASVPHIYGTVGYGIDVADDWTITPQALLRYVTATPTSAAFMADINVMAEYQKFLFGGLSYRTNAQDASLILGANLLEQKNLRIIYAADLVTPGATVEATARSSHEIGVSYALPFVVRPPKPAVKTPRFRF